MTNSCVKSPHAAPGPWSRRGARSADGKGDRSSGCQRSEGHQPVSPSVRSDVPNPGLRGLLGKGKEAAFVSMMMRHLPFHTAARMRHGLKAWGLLHQQINPQNRHSGLWTVRRLRENSEINKGIVTLWKTDGNLAHVF